MQTPDQIRTIARTLRDRGQTDLFPQRQELPKTLVFAKDDNHAEAIVGILREEWGRGVRVIKDDDLRGVNPGEHVHKDHFVIVDCVGVCERDKTDSRPMDQKKSVPLDALLQAVSLGNVEPEVLSSPALRTLILYNRPTRAPLKFEDLKALADTLQAPPHLWTESQLWQAYAALDQSKVKGASSRRILTDLVSLVRYAIHQKNEPVPYPERVAANFKAWIAQQQAAGKAFTEEQRWWLEKMAEHIASNLGIQAEGFGYAPFDQRGGLGRVHHLFGAELPSVIASLNEGLAA